MATTTRRSTRTRKTITEPVQATVQSTEVKETQTPTIIKKSTDFEPTDLIRCKSITAGELRVQGKRTHNMYTFMGNGDETYIEYQDLQALLMMRAESIMLPRFLILEDRILNDARWSKVKELYNHLHSDSDIEEILNLNPADFEATLRSVPQGLRDAIKSAIVTRLQDGAFDSIQKVQIVDRVCGTEIQSLILG